MISRKSSGSRRAESSVEPTRSQNITVSWRRSAVSARGGGDGAGAAVSVTGLPQPPQNLAVSSFSKPQAGQGEGSGAPHSAQKRLVATFSAMQLEQRIGCPWPTKQSKLTRELTGGGQDDGHRKWDICRN